MQILRTRFCDEIVAEVALPERQQGKVIIICRGAPSSPYRTSDRINSFLVSKGYGVIMFRHRGTWESDGEFLKRSPHEDIVDIIDELFKTRRIFDVYEKKWHKLQLKDLYLIGASFGGAPALLASRHAKVKKCVVLAPVIDWSVDGPDESFDDFKSLSLQGFGGAYRASSNNWKKLQGGNFCSPWKEMHTINSKKVLIIHAQDDRNVLASTSTEFSKRTGAQMILKKSGGHFGIRRLLYLRIWRDIEKFFKAK